MDFLCEKAVYDRLSERCTPSKTSLDKEPFARPIRSVVIVYLSDALLTCSPPALEINCPLIS